MSLAHYVLHQQEMNTAHFSNPPRYRNKVDVIDRRTEKVLYAVYNRDLNEICKKCYSRFLEDGIPVKVVSACGYKEWIG